MIATFLENTQIPEARCSGPYQVKERGDARWRHPALFLPHPTEWALGLDDAGREKNQQLLFAD
jgi:hypothetical protein